MSAYTCGNSGEGQQCSDEAVLANLKRDLHPLGDGELPNLAVVNRCCLERCLKKLLPVAPACINSQKPETD